MSVAAVASTCPCISGALVTTLSPSDTAASTAVHRLSPSGWVGVRTASGMPSDRSRNIPPGFEDAMKTAGHTFLLVTLHQMVHYGQIADARQDFDQQDGTPNVVISFDATGGRRFAPFPRNSARDFGRLPTPSSGLASKRSPRGSRPAAGHPWSSRPTTILFPPSSGVNEPMKSSHLLAAVAGEQTDRDLLADFDQGGYTPGRIDGVAQRTVIRRQPARGRRHRDASRRLPQRRAARARARGSRGN